MRLPVTMLFAMVLTVPTAARAQSAVSFDRQADRLHIRIHDQPFATYVWDDPVILRPYFCHLHAPNGVQVTRNHPPVEGQDPVDHATMHPGLWLAFGDMGGADFWRNRASVRQIEFVEDPHSTRQGAAFSVRNHYMAGERLICEELCRFAIHVRPAGFVIDWTADFTGPEDCAFGDQEEMGLGMRVATSLTVARDGQIRNSDGATNEAEVWGKPATWCDYSGIIDRQSAGITLMPDPANFRPCWFHARDYGLLVANPFGRRALTGGEVSRVIVRGGETLRLRFGILVHADNVDVATAYNDWLANRSVGEDDN